MREHGNSYFQALTECQAPGLSAFHAFSFMSYRKENVTQMSKWRLRKVK